MTRAPRRRAVRTPPSDRAATGIPGFDSLVGGGLPRGRTALVVGGPGCGKTIFALQSLLVGGTTSGEPGIFVTFEESPQRLRAAAEGFGWRPAARRRDTVVWIDARPSSDDVVEGPFDLNALLARTEAEARRIGARRVVFDGLDVLLDALPDDDARRELRRLHGWLDRLGLDGLLTAKVQEAGDLRHPYLHYLADAIVLLEQRLEAGGMVRRLRILKLRGGAHSGIACPFVIGREGMEVADLGGIELDYPVSRKRVSTGIAALDEMLGGGFFRGSSVLLSGSPGTAKSTLAGAFVAAACERGERALFVSFDEAADQIERNLASIGVRIEPHRRSGRLRMESSRSRPWNAQEHLVRIRSLWRAHEARCLVLDPISALSHAGSEQLAEDTANRLLDLARRDGVTTIGTSLLPEIGAETTPIGVSTMVDTWIHLANLAQGGERNRTLTIVKSRGMAHSNQVRELLLSGDGIELADAYTAGGEVLLGTLRWEREEAERQEAAARRHELVERQRDLEGRLAESEMRFAALEREIAMRRAELERLSELTRADEAAGAARRKEIRRRRGHARR